MSSLLSRAIDAVRVFIGLNDPSENHLTPSHGWLLPRQGARAVASGKAPVAATRANPGRPL